MSQSLVPPTTLPLLYFGFAHASLLAALTSIVIDPRAISGFYYHPRMLGTVHLVTLGWITGAILGAIRIVAPLVLQRAMLVTRGDYWAWGCLVLGTSGLVSHFWLESFNGMAWSAAMVWLGLVHPVTRIIYRILLPPFGGAAALYLVLSGSNILLAGGVGVLIAVDKVTDIVPGAALSNVYAHAHLAAVGWATMMVVGVGYRLLPIVIPSALPKGCTLYATAVFFQVGVLGLAASLATGWRGVGFFASCIAVGVAVFFSQVVWMIRHRRPPTRALAQPDVAALQAGLALLSLLVVVGCGLALAWSETAVWTPRLVMLYGVLGLVGFLGQMVVAMELRLLPLLAWYAVPPHGQLSGFLVHTLTAPGLARLSLGAWAIGVPVLALGLTCDHISLVTGGAGTLLFAVLLNTLQAGWILRPVLSRW